MVLSTSRWAETSKFLTILLGHLGFTTITSLHLLSTITINNVRCFRCTRLMVSQLAELKSKFPDSTLDISLSTALFPTVNLETKLLEGTLTHL